jgi:hypothetical protein
MLRAEMAPCFAMLLLLPTPTVADVTSELARCELEAERLYPAPHNKGAQNWPERAANLAPSALRKVSSADQRERTRLECYNHADRSSAKPGQGERR